MDNTDQLIILSRNESIGKIIAAGVGLFILITLIVLLCNWLKNKHDDDFKF